MRISYHSSENIADKTKAISSDAQYMAINLQLLLAKLCSLTFFEMMKVVVLFTKLMFPKFFLKVLTKQELTGNNTWLLRIISQQVN